MSHRYSDYSSSYPTHENPEPPHLTGRRSVLRWLIHGMGLITAAILGIPAVAYLIDPRNRAKASSSFKDVVRLSQLPVGEPREFILRETTRDAWTLHPNEIVGRVFLTRRNESMDQPIVTAHTTICPHLGCSVNFTGNTQSGETAFQCPCHGGRFDIQGKVFEGNVAPRDMDSLAVQYQPIPDSNDKMVQVEYKKFEAGKHEKVEMK